MAIKQGVDFVMNVDQPDEREFIKLANRSNAGFLFLGTKNYFFAIEVFDFKATFSTSYSFATETTYFKQTNHYFVNNIAGKTVPQALLQFMTDESAKLEDMEQFLDDLMTERGEESFIEGVSGEKVNIREAEKFKIMKMWVGGGTVNYKLPDDKFKKQIPIVKAADAKKLKAFYES